MLTRAGGRRQTLKLSVLKGSVRVSDLSRIVLI